MRLSLERVISQAAIGFGLYPLVVGMILAAGCTVEVPIDRGGGGSEAALRRQFQKDVLPLLQQSCATCHGENSADIYKDVRFMAPEGGAKDAYDAVFAWSKENGKTNDLIDKTDGLASPLITKGAHAGPAWSIDQRDAIIPWLKAVEMFFDTGNSLLTIPLTPSIGANTFDFGDIGITELAGNKLHFTYQLNSGILYLTSIEVEAGASVISLDSLDIGIIAGGNPQPRFDINNKFNGIVTEIAANTRECLGSCSLIAGWIPPEDLVGAIRLVFGFKAINSGGGGGGVVACSDVGFFYTNVVPEFDTLNCASCHGAGGSSTVFLDGLAIGPGDAKGQADQCSKVLIRTNRLDTSMEHDVIAQVLAQAHPVMPDITNLRTLLDNFVANEAQ